MVKRELKFAAPDDPFYDANDPIDLPSIHSYLPTETDIDVADALSALYRSHCISVIDCLRYCKAKMLFHSFTSFHGTLTVPVQKLFAHPNIAAWIKQCDWLMYQKMIRFVAPLALQAVPVQVIEAFKTVSTRLGSHVSTTFENLPQHVLDARLGPATIFANLLNRVIRVNQTAHAAANILNRDANRHQMWHDWVSYVKPFEVVQSSLPISGYSRVLRVLTSEIRDLLGPLDNSSCAGAGTIFETASNQSTPDYAQTVHIDPDNESPEGVLDRWINFLRNLPLRFPEADVRLILHCVNDIGSAALRDITMGQALSFGSWWVTKVWVDEMLQWLAEKGGFMQDCPESLEMRPKSYMDMDVTFMDEASEVFPVSRSRIDVSESVDPTIRFGSVDVGSGFHREQSRSASAAQQQLQQAEQSRIDIAEVNQVSHVRLAPAIGMDHMQSHDDSGIGMGVEDDELSMAKFGRFIEDGVDGESDPANVEVC
ncbi:hypothetical protein MMC12_002009 [Toensbergia leucococca]|nr:hypothetical protein [Toensbergia leucococca]